VLGVCDVLGVSGLEGRTIRVVEIFVRCLLATRD